MESVEELSCLYQSSWCRVFGTNRHPGSPLWPQLTSHGELFRFRPRSKEYPEADPIVSGSNQTPRHLYARDYVHINRGMDKACGLRPVLGCAAGLRSPDVVLVNGRQNLLKALGTPDVDGTVRV